MSAFVLSFCRDSMSPSLFLYVVVPPLISPFFLMVPASLFFNLDEGTITTIREQERKRMVPPPPKAGAATILLFCGSLWWFSSPLPLFFLWSFLSLFPVCGGYVSPFFLGGSFSSFGNDSTNVFFEVEIMESHHHHRRQRREKRPPPTERDKERDRVEKAAATKRARRGAATTTQEKERRRAIATPERERRERAHTKNKEKLVILPLSWWLSLSCLFLVDTFSLFSRGGFLSLSCSLVVGVPFFLR